MHQSLRRLEKRQLLYTSYFETPKTESSTRTFYADSALLSYLRTLRAAQAADEMKRETARIFERIVGK